MVVGAVFRETNAGRSMGYEVGHTSPHQKGLCPPLRPRASDSGEHSAGLVLGRTRMLSFDSYREVLSEHARGHHLVKSAWFVVVALAVFFVVFG